ncbi:hypothetical protein QYS36_19110 [Pseudomonas sp. G34]|uniref:hypothetical protein n=1 Tax=Pseudomonas sp. G34 TaxID=3059083 RepID=UPI00280A397A|nr:hypothetical protein [Pseudomonas sp. G34]MDQ7987054.1 hypothetical protein [Pseudomonas sp. G34]
MDPAFDELLEALQNLREVVSREQAWADNGGCVYLNDFAFSETADRRSVALQEPCNYAVSLGHTTFNFDSKGKVDPQQIEAIRAAGFGISDRADLSDLWIDLPPTTEAVAKYEDALKAGTLGSGLDAVKPSSMRLGVISPPGEDEYM